MDGFSPAQGDCNDCDAEVNPDAIEVLTTDLASPPADEDCDGQIDNIAPPCDSGIALDNVMPLQGAHAIDVCQKAIPGVKNWGLVEARYIRVDGAPLNPGLQVGVHSTFGTNVAPRAGSRLLALSTGHARTPGQAGACGMDSCDNVAIGNPPAGIPQDIPSCPADPTIRDDIGLELKLRAPSNAEGYAFDLFFYAFDYPQYVCDGYNDQFLALANPPPAGSILGNISFDAMGRPVGVNFAPFNVCDGCLLGVDALTGTGFDTWGMVPAGGTGWLTTRAPMTGGEEVTLRFVTWDTADGAFDSTTLLDNFRWITTGAVSTVTEPVD